MTESEAVRGAELAVIGSVALSLRRLLLHDTGVAVDEKFRVHARLRPHDRDLIQVLCRIGTGEAIERGRDHGHGHQTGCILVRVPVRAHVRAHVRTLGLIPTPVTVHLLEGVGGSEA